MTGGGSRTSPRRPEALKRIWSRSAALAVAVLLLTAPVGIPGQARPWVIEVEPTLELGTGQGGPGDELGLVLAAVRTPEGGVAVLDALQAAVKLFDGQGRHVRDLGRRGDGPGEFRDPSALSIRGDSLVVLDRVGRRTWLDREGAVLASDRVSIEPLCDERFSARFGGLLPDASLVVRCQERLFGRVSGEYRQRIGVLLVRRDGEVRSLGVFPADSGRTDARGVPVPRPYSPGSPLLWAAAGERIFVASADSPEVAVFTSSGTREKVLPVPATPRAATQEDRQEEAEDALRIVGNENDRRVVGEWYSERPRRASTPALRTLLAATSDELWIESWDRVEGRSWWLVADVSAERFERVLGPPRSTLLAVGHDWTLWLWRDAFDVEHVRLHPLRRN